MSTLNKNTTLSEIYIVPADLWPGATRDDCRAVAARLNAVGMRAYSIGTGQGNIPALLAAADHFRAAVLDLAETAVTQAIAAQETARLQEVKVARAAVQEALQARDRAEAELEMAVSRLQALQAG